jgi:hypothetical protein
MYYLNGTRIRRLMITRQREMGKQVEKVRWEGKEETEKNIEKERKNNRVAYRVVHNNTQILSYR